MARKREFWIRASTAVVAALGGALAWQWVENLIRTAHMRSPTWINSPFAQIAGALLALGLATWLVDRRRRERNDGALLCATAAALGAGAKALAFDGTYTVVGLSATAFLFILLLPAAVLALVLLVRKRGAKEEPPAPTAPQASPLPCFFGVAGALVVAALVASQVPSLDAAHAAISRVFGVAFIALAVGLVLGAPLAQRVKEPIGLAGLLLGLAAIGAGAGLMASGGLVVARLSFRAGGAALLEGHGPLAASVGIPALCVGLAWPAVRRVALQRRADTPRARGAFAWLATGLALGVVATAWFQRAMTSSVLPLLAGMAILLGTSAWLLLRQRDRVARTALVVVAGAALYLAWPGNVARAATWLPDARLEALLASHHALPPQARTHEDFLLCAAYAGFATTNGPYLLESASGPPALLHRGRAIATLGLDDAGAPTAPLHESFAGCLAGLLGPTPQRALVATCGAGFEVEALLAWGLRDVSVAVHDAEESAGRSALRAHLGLPAGSRAQRLAGSAHAALTTAADRPETQRYDVVIISSGLRERGAGRLAPTEATFKLAKSALSPFGIVVLRLDLAGLDATAIRATVRTFGSVFSAPSLWRVPGTAFLVGGNAAIQPTISVAAWQPRWPDVMRLPAFPHTELASPADVLRHLVGDGASVGYWLRTLRETLAEDDERALAWVRAGLDDSRRTGTPETAERALTAAFPPQLWAPRAAGDGNQPALQPLFNLAAQAIERWVAMDDPDLAAAWAEGIAWPPHPRLSLARAKSAAALGAYDRALELIRAVGGARPPSNEAEPRAILAAEILGAWPGVEAEAELAAIEEAYAGRPAALAAVGAAWLARGRPERAAAAYRASLAGNETARGRRAQLARALLAGSATASEQREALALLRADPTTYEDPALLDLFVRIDTVFRDATVADDGALRALDGLARSKAFQLLAATQDALRWGRWEDAARLAMRAQALDPRIGLAFELEALATLFAAAGAVDQNYREQVAARAGAALVQGLDHAADREQFAARGRTLLGWFGQSTQHLDEAAAHGVVEE